jgi:monoamine oxidase
MPIARDLGLTTIATDYDSIEGFRSDGKKLTLDQLAEAFLDEQKFEKYIDSRRDEGFQANQMKSLANLLSDWPERATMEPERRRLFDLALRCETTLDYAAEPTHLAWPGFDHGRWMQGQDHYITEGYDQIVNHLARELPIDKEVIVREVDITGATPVVRTSKGEIVAKQIVITVPLGVLKAGSIRFRPELPREKREAVRLLGMGHVSKIALRFPKIFWPKRELLLFEGSGGEGFDAYHLGVWSNEPVLQTYQAGEAAMKEESLSPQKRVEGVLNHLRHAFPKTWVEPADFQVTDWSNDPFSKGAYSFVKTGSIPQHREDLALPVDGKLFFAGEATHLDHPSTVHGAYLSGIREAKRVIRA